MSLFSKILDKLGLKKEKEQPAVAAHALVPKSAPAPVAKPATQAPAAKPATPVATAPVAAKPQDEFKDARLPQVVQPAAAAPKPVSEMDVVKHLEELSRGKNSNWKVSIVDLLNLLDLDSSYEARVEMAKELNCPPELMKDSAKMNTWLHKAVLKEIAENGGNIPKELLD